MGWGYGMEEWGWGIEYFGMKRVVVGGEEIGEEGKWDEGWRIRILCYLKGFGLLIDELVGGI